ncbi:MAG: isoprenylcysteine carboxylmethyltransferase family protein [Verrucomicrobiota bacterium]
MRWLELKVPPVLLTALLFAAMYGVATATPDAAVRIPGRTGITTGLALLGTVVALAGVLEFRVNRTTANPFNPGAASTVVTRGVYRFSRNPMYLGLLMVLAAWAIHLANLITALALPAFVAYMNEFQIKPEERTLRAKFGTAFSEYQATVRRWV